MTRLTPTIPVQCVRVVDNLFASDTPVFRGFAFLILPLVIRWQGEHSPHYFLGGRVYSWWIAMTQRASSFLLRSWHFSLLSYPRFTNIGHLTALIRMQEYGHNLLSLWTLQVRNLKVIQLRSSSIIISPCVCLGNGLTEIHQQFLRLHKCVYRLDDVYLA